jgi:ribosomal 50S subunit-recycling heat shock protein
MRIIRFTLLLYCFILLGKTALAQNLKLADEPAQFMVQFKKLMDGSRNPQYMRAAAQLDSIWMSSFNTAQQMKFTGIVKAQVAKGQKAGPVLYLLSRNAAFFAKQSPENFDSFLALAAQTGEKYDGKTLQKVLETVRILNETKKLYAANYNSLYLLEGSYKYRFDSANVDRANVEAAINDSWDAPVDTNFVIALKSIPLPIVSGALLDLQNARFAMVTGSDSVVFGPANGSISLQDGIFVGKNGKFDWQAAGDSSIYVDLDAFSFNITQPKLVAENVTLHHQMLVGPIKGKVEYRGIKKVKGQPAPYPRFVSNGIDAQLKDTRKSIDYKGGFSLIGLDMYSTALSGEPSTLKVKYKDKVAFTATSKKFALRDSVISASFATYSMPLGSDSIYHQGVTFKYNDDEGLVKTGRMEKTDYAPLPYQDSYHKMNIWAQAMRWRFTNDKLEFLRIDGKQVVPVTLESQDFFKKERFREIAKEYGFQPLNMAASYVQATKKSSFLSEELAAKFKQNPKIVRNTLDRLTLEGYFIYNKATDEYALSKKGALYVLANIDKADYDNFQVASQYTANNETANATIYMPDTLLTVLGVSSFVVSDSLKIHAAPSDKKLIIGKNRNFTLNGRMVASNYQFRGQNIKFDYNQFFVNVAPSDSITFTPKEKYAKGQKGEVGGHVKYDKGGTFYLSDPKNKSGLQKGVKKSPRLVVEDGMTVFFDQEERGPITYPKENVFFKIPKLDMGGLDERDVIFDGTFTSGGIIPPIKTVLKSMPDNSLGFEYKPPVTDMPIYNGQAQARFTDTLTMDNTGLHSKAVIKYLSTTITAKNVVLASDSLMASGEIASIKEATIGKGYFPAVALKDYALKWYPNADSMFINTTGKSFSFHNGTTNLEGSLLLRSSGLYGNGKLKRADSELSSPDIKFNKDGFLANRSSFAINSSEAKSSKKLLTGNNVNIDFNFKTGIANFLTDETGFGNDSSGMQIPTASYQTLIGSAKWDMNKKTILMKGIGETSTYTSTDSTQEGLTFSGSEALYDIEKVSLNIKGVPFIQTADVKIIPDKGIVSVDSKGKIAPLKKARIEIDTLNVAHRMRDADIRIDSRNHFEGSATYQYITARKDTFNIKMQNFELREIGAETEGKRSKNNNQTGPIKYYTTARADVKEEENLILSPRIQFKGGINLIAYEPSLQLDGFVKPMIKFRKDFQSSWIVYKESPGESVAIKINKDLKNEHEIPLSVGLHYNETRGMYMSFLSPKESDGDEDIYLAQGALNYDEDQKAFKVTPPPGADGLIDEANALRFDDKTGLATFSGPFKFIGADWLQSVGSAEVQVDSSKFTFNSMLLLKMPAFEPIAQPMAAKIVETNLEEQNSTAADDDAEQLNQKLSALIGSKATDAYAKLTAAGYKPLFEASPALDVPMVLSNVNLHWSPAHQAYYSQGPIGVAHFGRNNINAQMDGVLEIRRGVEGDEFSLFLQASPDVWYYIDYKLGELGVVSSMVDFNDQITAKSKNVKSKDMTLVSIGTEEKDMFVNRFDDFYQPAIKKAKLVKSTAKKKPVSTPAEQKKKKEEPTEGF